MLFTTGLLVSLLLTATSVLAHPGADFAAELAHRRNSPQNSEANLQHCRDRLVEDELKNRKRYADVLATLQDERGLERRDFPEFNHTHSHAGEFDLGSDPHDIFDKYPTCVLTPDVTEGPFYVEGEFIRSDITDDQAGVPLYLDIQLKDFATCDYVKDVYVEIWHANATGTYSGTGAQHGQTFLRGLQKTDERGTVSFKTVMPGHYYERAPHVHVAAHVSSQSTQPWSDGAVRDHVVSLSAQLFFDQQLVTDVKRLDPYRGNAQEFIWNDDDAFLAQEAAGRFDPFVTYARLSGDLGRDGVLAWITVGANMTEHRGLAVADHRP